MISLSLKKIFFFTCSGDPAVNPGLYISENILLVPVFQHKKKKRLSLFTEDVFFKYKNAKLSEDHFTIK